MKTLYLLRHAKSSWDDESLDDFDRPLAERGRLACAPLRRVMKRHWIAPQVILCSASRRTQETLDGIGLSTSPAVAIETQLYLASAAKLLARLRRLEGESDSAMVIGHNPGLQRLALSLTGSGDDDARARLAAKFPTASLAMLQFEGSWRALKHGGCALTLFWTPRGAED